MSLTFTRDDSMCLWAGHPQGRTSLPVSDQPGRLHFRRTRWLLPATCSRRIWEQVHLRIEQVWKHKGVLCIGKAAAAQERLSRSGRPSLALGDAFSRDLTFCIAFRGPVSLRLAISLVRKSIYLPHPPVLAVSVNLDLPYMCHHHQPPQNQSSHHDV